VVGSSVPTDGVQGTDGEGISRLRGIVRGRVQGVGFRYFTQSEARMLGLRGQVRNCADGSVEVVAEGTKPSLELLLLRLREGSRTAYVEHIEVEWQAATGEYGRFNVRF